MVTPIAEPPGRKDNGQKELFPDKSDGRDGPAEASSHIRNGMDGSKRGSSDRRDNPNINNLPYLRPQFQTMRGEVSSRAVKETAPHDPRQDNTIHPHRAPSRPEIHSTEERKLSSNSTRRADEDKPAYKFVKCRQIPPRISVKDLFSAFSILDRPTSVTILRKPTGSSLGFVQFSYSSLAKKTMKELNGASLGGRPLFLVLAPKVDRDRGSTTEKWDAEDENRWREEEVKRLNKIFENRCHLFTSCYVAFARDIDSQYPDETSLQRKKRIFHLFVTSKERAYERLKSRISLYNINNVQQLIPSESGLQLAHLEAFFLTISQYSERLGDMRLLRTAWEKDVKLPLRNYGQKVERLVRIRNFLSHLLDGAMTSKVPWDEIWEFLAYDLDDVHEEQAESDSRWDSCFQANMAKRQSLDDTEDHGAAVEESWYDQGR